MGSLKAEDPKELQKTFFDVLNNSNDAILKSLEGIHLDLIKRIALIETLQRKEMFLQLLHSRELSPDEYGKLEKAANRRIKVLLEDVDTL